jgi:hypothetical protein
VVNLEEVGAAAAERRLPATVKNLNVSNYTASVLPTANLVRTAIVLAVPTSQIMIKKELMLNRIYLRETLMLLNLRLIKPL